MILYISIIVIMAILSMASGASLPGSNLLNKKGELSNEGKDKGGIMPFNLTFLPELLFGMIIGWCGVQVVQNLTPMDITTIDWTLNLYFLTITAPVANWLFIAFSAWAYIWMQTGHAAILPWDKADKRTTRSRDNTLTPVVHFLCRITGITYISGGKYTEAYVWAFAAVKGFLIGLPVGGLPLAGFWPLGYEIGSHAKNHLAGASWDLHMVSEGSAGAGAGLSCVIGLAASAAIGAWLGFV